MLRSLVRPSARLARGRECVCVAERGCVGGDYMLWSVAVAVIFVLLCVPFGLALVLSRDGEA